MTRRSPLNPLIAMAVCSGGLGLTLVSFARMMDTAPPAGLVGMGLAVAGLIAVMIGLTLMYWRRLDEAARMAHQSAWFWGGQVGLLIIVLGFAFLAAKPDAAVEPLFGFEPTPAHYVALGMMGAMVCLSVAYLIGWAVWWFVKGR